MPKDAEIDNLEMDEMGAMIKIQITGSNFWVMDEMGWNEGKKYSSDLGICRIKYRERMH